MAWLVRCDNCEETAELAVCPLPIYIGWLGGEQPELIAGRMTPVRRDRGEYLEQLGPDIKLPTGWVADSQSQYCPGCAAPEAAVAEWEQARAAAGKD